MLSSQGRDKCKVYMDGQLICRQYKPMYNIQGGSPRREMAIILHPETIPRKCQFSPVTEDQRWTNLAHSNHFLYTMVGEKTVSLICNNDVQLCQLNGSDVLRMDPQCTIKSGSMEISSANSHTSSFPSILVPAAIAANLSDLLLSGEENFINGKQSERSWEVFTINPDIVKLEQAVALQKENIGTITKMNWHDVHHYSISYISVAAIIAGIIYIYFRFIRVKKLKSRNEMIELQTQSHGLFDRPNLSGHVLPASVIYLFIRSMLFI